MKKQAITKKNGIRPSPNEVAAIIQSEQERRKKIRLKQVREQEKEFARKVRQNIKRKRDSELKILSDELKKEWTEKQLEEQKILEEKYQNNLSKFGDGHTGAIVDQNTEKKDSRVLTKEEKQRAIERHNAAIHQLLIQNEKDQEAQRNLLEARAKALEAERERAAMVASLPLPQSIFLDFELTKGQMGQPKKLDDFKSTHFHLQKAHAYVEKMDKDLQPDARYDALVAETKMKEIFDDNQRSQSEQVEKARLRHKHALDKLRIEEDRKKLLDELDELQRMDRQRRQETVAKIPVRIFQPPHKRVEDAEERQRDLEQAFEDMYMLQTGYTGDLTIALEPSTDQVIIPEQHQLLVPDKRPEDQLGPTIPIPGSGEADEIAIYDGDTVIEGEEDDRSEVQEKQKPSLPPKGEDAVKRLLQNIQRQRKQAKEAELEEKPTDRVERSQKTPLLPPLTVAKPSGPKVNVMTPVLEEDELQQDEDIPRSGFPTLHPMETKPTTGSPVRDAGNIREAHTLLHPNEAARQARTTSTLSGEETTDASRETTPFPPVNEEDIQKERLTRQLEEQRLIQQSLEDQLKEYQTKIQELSSQRQVPYYEVIPQRLLAPDDRYDENPTVPYEKGAAEVTEPNDQSDGGASRSYHDRDGGRPMVPCHVDATEHLALFANGATRPMEQFDGEAMHTEETGEESVTKANEDIKYSTQIPFDIRRVVEQKREGSLPSLESGSLSEEQTADEMETEETSSSSSDGWPQQQHSTRIPAKQNITDYSSRPAFSTGIAPTFQKLPQEQLSLAFETTGESFPKENSSDSEGKFDSEDLSSVSGSVDLKHEVVPTTCHFTQEVVHSLPSSMLSSVVTDSTRGHFSSLTSEPSRKTSEQTNASLVSSPFRSITEVSSYQEPRLRTSGLANVTPVPVAFANAPKDPGVTLSYLDEYRRKWEEEKKLIESQRKLIKQKQEQQLRRMRYYKDILDRHEKSDSPGVAYSAPLKDFSTLPISSRYEGSSALLLPSQKGQFGSKFSQDSAEVLSDYTSPSFSSKNKENESVHANIQVPRVVGLRESSTSSEGSFQKSLPWTSDSYSSGQLRNQFSMSTKQFRASQKSTTSSDISLPTSGTEYHSLPLSPDPSALGTNLDLANVSRSSITTLSELNEMMSKFTSSSDNEVQKDANMEMGKPTGRPSWSQYLSEINITKHDSVSSTNEATSRSYNSQESNVVIPREAIHTTQATSDNGTRELYSPIKSSMQSVGSAELNESVFTGSLPPMQKQASNRFGDGSTREQLLQTLDLISDDSSDGSNTVHSKRNENIIFGRSHTAFDEGQNSVTLVSNVESSSISSSFSERPWVGLPKVSTQTMGSSDSLRQVSRSSTQVESTGLRSPIRDLALPPKASTQSIVSGGSLNDVSSGVLQFGSDSVSSFSQCATPPKPSTQNMPSATPQPSSPERRWLLPTRASTHSVGSTGSAAEIPSTGTEVINEAQSTDTDKNFPLLKWLPPPRASTQSVGLTRPAGETRSLDTSRSSPVLQWLPPPKASTQSLGSDAPISSSSNKVSSIYSSSSSSSVQQWFLPPKASTQTMGSIGETMKDGNPATTRPSSQWYPPTKASTQSLALQETHYGDVSPDQSVFIRESMSGNNPTSWVAASSTSPTLVKLDGGSDSSSTSDNVKIRLQNMGDVFLQLDKFLDAPSPTTSLSSGSIEPDHVISKSDHSTVNSSATTEEVVAPLQTMETSIAETSKEAGSSFQDSKSASEIQSEISESMNTSSSNSNSVSLQEAFAQRKQEFVKKSLARVTRAKEKRFVVKPRVHVKPKGTKKETKKKSHEKKKLPEK